MKSGLRETLRSRQFALLVHLGLWALFIVAVMGISGTAPDFRESDSYSTPPQSPVPAARLAQIFSAWPRQLLNTNMLDPFYTRHFIPTQAPAPPPPTTAKFELTYQG